MKTTPRLKPSIFAAAATLALAGPVAVAAPYEVNGILTLGDGGSSLGIIHPDGVVVGASTFGNLTINNNGGVNADYLEINGSRDNWVKVFSGGFISVSGFVSVGTGGGSGDTVLTVDGGTVTAESLSVGDGAGRDVLNVSGGGTIELSRNLNLATNARVNVTLANGPIPIIVHGSISTAGLGFSLRVFAEGGVPVAPDTLFTVMYVGGGVDPLLFGSSFVDSVTGQTFIAEVNDGHYIELTAQAIPEPSTYALIGGAGAVALALLRRRRKGL